MPVISLKSFSGGIPKLPADRLPDNNAQVAINCDFAYGDLRGLPEDAAVGGARAFSNAQSIWTDNGAAFFYWGSQVEAVKSPQINDIHKRLIFTKGNGEDARVLSLANGSPGHVAPTSQGTTPAGLKLGVLPPTFGSGGDMKVRVVNYESDITGADYPRYPEFMDNGAANVNWFYPIKGLKVGVRFFYESDGVKYQESISPLVNGVYTNYLVAPRSACQEIKWYSWDSAGAIYGFDAYVIGKLLHHVIPQRDTETPSNAVPMVQITGKINGEQVFSVYPSDSAFISTKGKMMASMELTRETYDPYVISSTLAFGAQRTVALVDTYVNEFGEESTPGAPVLVDLSYGQSLECYKTFTQSGPINSETDYSLISTWRIYGTNTSSAGSTDYYLAHEADITTVGGVGFATISRGGSIPAQANIITTPEDWIDRLETADWGLPPEGATGVVSLGNGILAMFRNTASDTYENEIWFCEPYHPYTWPSKYVITVPQPVVGIVAHGGGMLVTTKGHPHFIYGSHPSAMTAPKLPVVQAGISKRSMVDAGSHAVFASNDGLVAVRNTDINIEMSQRFFTRKAWREKYGTRLQYLNLAYHDGYLIGYFTDGADGFCIRLDEAEGTFTEVSGSGYKCHCNSPLADALYLHTSNTIKSFASSSTARSLTRQTKDFILAETGNFAACQVILGSGSATVKVYADGVEKSTKNVTVGATTYRLPAGFVARKWSVKVTGVCVINEIHLATSMQELASV